MNYYEFTAVDSNQKIVKGTIRAKNSGNACWQLKKRNFLPVRLHEMSGDNYDHAKRLHEARSLKVRLSGKKQQEETFRNNKKPMPRLGVGWFKHLAPLALALIIIVVLWMLGLIN